MSAVHRESLLMIVLILAGASALGQAKPVATAPATPPKPAAPVKNIACESTPLPTVGFTSCEMLVISNASNQMQTIQAEQIAPIRQQVNEFIQKVLANSPGKQYEQPTQQYPFGRIVDPPPPAPARTVPSAPAHPPANAGVAPAPAATTAPAAKK